MEILWAAVNQRANVQRYSEVRAMRIKEATLEKGKSGVEIKLKFGLEGWEIGRD